MRTRNLSLLIAIFLVVALAVVYVVAINPIGKYFTLGLDLRGGVRVVLQAQATQDQPVTTDALTAAEQVIQERINGMGISEPNIQIDTQAKRIIVEIAGYKDPDAAVAAIGQTANLRFVGPDGSTILTGNELTDAQPEIQGTSDYVVSLQFNKQGTQAFADATKKFLGQDITIYLDQQPIQTAVVKTEIPDGKAVIEGFKSFDEVKRLAAILRSGALPVTLNVIEKRVVQPTMGEQWLHYMLLAAMLGVGLVVLYMILFYRLAGVTADFALAVYILLVLGVLLALHATLTLPGIAGIILGVGMAVDANVISFERIKEELRRGRTGRSAVDAGFSGALRAIIDSNVTTLIAALVLYYYGTGPIKGFAVTLTVSIVVSMFTAVVFTHYILRLLAGADLLRNSRLYFGV